MATGTITITIEQDIPESGSGGPALGHTGYRLKKLLEMSRQDFQGNPRVVRIRTEQTPDTENG